MSITGVVSPGTEIIIVDKASQGVLSLPSTTAEAGSRPRFVPLSAAPPSKALRFRLLEAGPSPTAPRPEHSSFVLEAVGVGERGLSAPLYLAPNEESRVQLQAEPFRFLFEPSYPIFANSSYQLAFGPSRLIIPWAPAGGQKRPAELHATLLPLTWFSPSGSGGSPSCVPKSGLSVLLEDLRLRLLNGYTESLLCEKDIEFGTCPEGRSCGDTVGGRWKAGCVGPCASPSEACSYDEQGGKFACARPPAGAPAPEDQQHLARQEHTGRRAPWWLWLLLGLVALFALVLVGGGLLYWLRFRRGRSSKEKEDLIEVMEKAPAAKTAAKSPPARRAAVAPAALSPAKRENTASGSNGSAGEKMETKAGTENAAGTGNGTSASRKQNENHERKVESPESPAPISSLK